MKKTLSTFFALITLLSCLAGCADNSSVKDTTVPDTTEKTETTDFADTTDCVTDTEETTADISSDTSDVSEDNSIDPYGEHFFFPKDSSLSDLAYSTYMLELSYEDFLANTEVQKYIAENLSEITGVDVSWSDFNVHIVETGAMYPMTIVLSVYDGYDTMINFSTFEKGAFRYSTPYKMYGRYETESLMSVGHPEYYHINREDMENAILAAADVDDLTIKYVAVSLSEADRKITVPIFSGNDPYVAVLKIEDDLTYTLESFQKLDFGTMTVYDFLVTYEAFGFEPLDLVLNDCGIPLSPENAILDIFGTLDVLESMYTCSEFSYSPYVRLQTKIQLPGEPEIDVSFYLVDKLTGEKLNTTELSPDAKFEDFVWKSW